MGKRRNRARMAARAALVALLAAVFAGIPAAAQEPPAEAPPADDSVVVDRETIEAQREQVAARIAKLHAAADPDAETLGLLERRERLLSQLLDAMARRDEAAEEVDAARNSLTQPPRDELAHDPPYTLAEFDALLEEHRGSSQLLDDLKQAASGVGAALESARDSLEKAEQARRAAREDSGSEAAPPLNDLQVEVGETELALRRLEVERSRLALDTTGQRLSRLREVIAWAEGRVRPTPQELDERKRELDSQVEKLSRRRERVEVQLNAARDRWEQAVARASGDASVGAELGGEAAARRAELASIQKEMALLGKQLDRLERSRELLRRRFAFFEPERPERSELAIWNVESRDALAAIARDIQLARAEKSDVIQALRSLESAEAGGPDAQWKARQVDALLHTTETYDANLASLEAMLQREQLMLLTIERQLGSVDFAGRARQIGIALGDLWGFEVTSSEDRSITVGRIATGAMVFLFGLVLARVLTHWFGPRLLSRAKVDEGAAHAYQSLGYYALLAIVFITALRVVDIPLTAFAVVGGALAIGIGFGSQNIVNNFISGVILLAERPIKRGDLVEIEGTYGNIERIGLRSTRVRTGDNIHVIVPNSAFLENRVINWTHNDRKVRIRVSVGVVYGSPTREVERLILKALVEHPHVQNEPAPVVLFTEFGDNSLNFEARFWVVIRSLMGRLLIESDVRYKIDDLFREAGIVIAFPQRDIHLDAVAPIPVRLLRERPEEEAES